MQTQRVVATLANALGGFSEALSQSKSLYDYFHITFAFTRFHHRVLPRIATESLSDNEFDVIFSEIVEFGVRANAVREGLAARPGHSTSFNRALTSLPEGERSMPAALLRYLRVLTDRQLTHLSAIVQVLFPGVVCLRLQNAFLLSSLQAHSAVMLFASPLALRWPQALASLPKAALDALLVSDDGLEDTFTASNPLIRHLAGDKEPVVIEMVAAEGHMRTLLLRGLIKAVRDRDVAPLAEVVLAEEVFLWFLTSKLRLPLPDTDFRRFDGSFNYESLLRETENATIHRDDKNWVVFEHASLPSKAVVVRFPAGMDWFCRDKDINLYRDYNAGPLVV